MRARFLILCAGLSLMGCSRTDMATAPAAPTFDFSNNPDNGNVRVFRYQDEFAIAWTDPGSNLRVTHWSSQFANEPGCGNFEGGGPIAFQQVGQEDLADFFASQFRINAMGSVWIIVRDLNQPGNCFGAALVAEGWGSIHYTDNDAFGLNPDQSSANAWGFMGNGVLTMPAGGTVRYSGHLRAAVSGAGQHADGQATINLR